MHDVIIAKSFSFFLAFSFSFDSCFSFFSLCSCHYSTPFHKPTTDDFGISLAHTVHTANCRCALLHGEQPSFFFFLSSFFSFSSLLFSIASPFANSFQTVSDTSGSFFCISFSGRSLSAPVVYEKKSNPLLCAMPRHTYTQASRERHVYKVDSSLLSSTCRPHNNKESTPLGE